jgi:chromosome segregation ATPase
VTPAEVALLVGPLSGLIGVGLTQLVHWRLARTRRVVEVRAEDRLDRRSVLEEVQALWARISDLESSWETARMRRYEAESALGGARMELAEARSELSIAQIELRDTRQRLEELGLEVALVNQSYGQVLEALAACAVRCNHHIGCEAVALARP